MHRLPRLSTPHSFVAEFFSAHRYSKRLPSWQSSPASWFSLLAISISLLLSSCAPSEGDGERRQKNDSRSVEALADEYLAAYLVRYPETATFYGLESPHHGKLTDNSQSARKTWEDREDLWLEELSALVGQPRVGTRDWVTKGILREALEGSIAVRVCRHDLWSVSQMTGWQTSLPSLFEIQAQETSEQRADLLERLQALVTVVTDEIANHRIGLEAGFSSPKRNVRMVIEEARGLLEEGSPLFSPARKASEDDNLGGEAFAARYLEILEGPVREAILNYASYLEDEYLTKARDNIAVATNPQGTDCYPATIRSNSTVNKTAEEVHQLGLEQIASIRAEMQTIANRDFGTDLEELIPKLNQDPRFTFPNRQSVIDYHERKLEEVKSAVPQWFGITPKADVVIKPYPAYREASGTGEYQSSSQDGSRPGVFFIATRNPKQRSQAGQESLLFHEAYPGHHLQGAIALELGDSVHSLARLLYNSGYAEGWGLYSERLGDEMGLYTGPIDRLGMLSDQAARAARLVVDSGLHAKGWSRQQAIDYMLQNTAWPPGDIEAEVDRYVIMPGQATSYMLGMLEILAARDEAQSALGDKFEIREFHDRVLENGSLTLPMLREKISEWATHTSHP